MIQRVRKGKSIELKSNFLLEGMALDSEVLVVSEICHR